MAAVTLNGVSKRFGNLTAVDQLDLRIADGEFVVLVGPSGCGKTTILRMIAGLESASSGSIMIGNRSLDGRHPRDRDVAMVFQSYALYPHLTVYENLAFALRQRRGDRENLEDRIHEASETLGISGILSRMPEEISGGQQQRVALCRTIVRRPSVFLFDEPLSNLDANMRVDLRAEIKRLHHRLGQTMIYVTHDQTEAMTMGDRIVVLCEGAVRQAGPPMTLYDHPADTFVATFIGSPRMNCIQGEFRRGPEGARFVTGSLDFLLRDEWNHLTNGAQVQLGVRSEQISLGSPSPSDTLHRNIAVIELIEPIGSCVLIHVRQEQTNWIVVQTAPHSFQRGQQVTLNVNRDHTHLFDSTTGKSLRHVPRTPGGSPTSSGPPNSSP